jgi:hypothetical protein
MTDYFEVITNASTGEQTIRPYTEEEIAAVEAANAPTREGQEAKRQAAYASESDPLFFMSQRGEATVEEWTAKVAEIKARYPYPTEEV